MVGVKFNQVIAPDYWRRGRLTKCVSQTVHDPRTDASANCRKETGCDESKITPLIPKPCERESKQAEQKEEHGCDSRDFKHLIGFITKRSAKEDKEEDACVKYFCHWSKVING